jgi:hypothetical protein
VRVARYLALVVLALGFASGCRHRAPEHPKPVKDSLHQSNVDFDYLGDDDDDDDTGGAGGNVFDATINSSLASSAAVGAAIPFQVDAVAGGGAQTLGSIKVTVTESSGAVANPPTTTSAAGWTETGWSYSGGVWSNTLTKASVAVGTTSPTFSVSASSGGTGGGLVIATSTSAPHTAEATGAGNSRIVLISAASFDAIGSAPATVASGGSFTLSVAITAGGSAQTNGAVVVTVGAFSNPVSGMTTTALDGWAESGWVFSNADGAQVWRNTLTRTAVPIGTTNPTFSASLATLAPEDPHTVTCKTFASSDPPQTTEATGAGNTVTVTVL